MLFHFKDRFPALTPYWDRYMAFQKRMEVPAKTILLKEGTLSQHYIFVEKGCVRAAFNITATIKQYNSSLRTKG
jgi:hypothetical protein